VQLGFFLKLHHAMQLVTLTRLATKPVLTPNPEREGVDGDGASERRERRGRRKELWII
jgi:hypothetical protein